MAGKKQNMAPTWKTLMKHDLDEPTSILDHEFLEQLKTYQGEQNLPQRRLRGPTMWKDMLASALRVVANWQTKKSAAVVQGFKSLLG